MQQINVYDGAFGLTGVIGSGKSTAAGFFRDCGAHVIDADALAREVMTPEYEGFHVLKKDLESSFALELKSKSLFDSNDKLDRKLLAGIAFSSEKKLQTLNALVHPHVKRLFSL